MDMTHDEQRLSKAERIFNNWNARIRLHVWNGNWAAAGRIAKRLERFCRDMAPIQARVETKFYIGQ
jgi:hypothetical protein